MSLQESYGFDSFCQELVQTWPTISLTFRRVQNRLFVTASAMDVLAVAIGENDELAGSTVRRAAADLHARLVVRGPLATLRPTEGPALNTNEEAVFSIIKKMQSLEEELANLEDLGDELHDDLAEFMNGGGNLEDATRAGQQLPLLRVEMDKLQEELGALEDKLDELDPEREIESALADSGRL